MKEQILQLIGRHDGRWGWYQLDRYLSTHFSPPGREMMVLLDELIQEGLIENRASPGNQPQYALTESGRKRFAESVAAPDSP